MLYEICYCEFDRYRNFILYSMLGLTQKTNKRQVTHFLFRSMFSSKGLSIFALINFILKNFCFIMALNFIKETTFNADGYANGNKSKISVDKYS